MSNSLMMMQPFLQSQSSAMSQHHQRIWDSLHQDTRSFGTENREGKKFKRPWKRLPLPPMEEITPTPQEKEVEGQREQENKDEDLECELQMSPMDVDKSW